MKMKKEHSKGVKDTFIEFLNVEKGIKLYKKNLNIPVS